MGKFISLANAKEMTNRYQNKNANEEEEDILDDNERCPPTCNTSLLIR